MRRSTILTLVACQLAAVTANFECHGVILPDSLRGLSCSDGGELGLLADGLSLGSLADLPSYLETRGCRLYTPSNPDSFFDQCRQGQGSSFDGQDNDLRRRGIVQDFTSWVGGGGGDSPSTTANNNKPQKTSSANSKSQPTTNQPSMQSSNTPTSQSSAPTTMTSAKSSSSPSTTSQTSTSTSKSTSTSSSTTSSTSSESTSTTSSSSSSSSSSSTTSTTSTSSSSSSTQTPSPTSTSALPTATVLPVQKPSGASNGTKVALGVVGALAGLTIILLALFWIRRRKRNIEKARMARLRSEHLTGKDDDNWRSSDNSLEGGSMFADKQSSSMQHDRRYPQNDTIPMTRANTWNTEQSGQLPRANLQRELSFNSQPGSETLNRPDPTFNPPAPKQEYVAYKPFASSYKEPEPGSTSPISRFGTPPVPPPNLAVPRKPVRARTSE
ncbi:MAG: hypothetical protein M1824_003135 [Vezdaea acicularis]|nr:MAG: hypothetical protein M1824_003135 [Vezdaea acicularis]